MSSRGRILVTGGAGYIGSHAVLSLLANGWEVSVVDDLSTGSRKLLPREAALHVGDVGDSELMARVLAEVRPEAVMHFAGSISVPESVANPLKYYRNNLVASCRLLESCVTAGVHRFIFSSTAAVYGIPEVLPVLEDAPTQPINPYGRSKLAFEDVLADTAAATPLRYVALRYFNVAGADAAGRCGQIVKNSTNLIKVVAELAAGTRDSVVVNGSDYPTPDGTCIRDFIHVSDLADAHVTALGFLIDGGASTIMNCGYGHGYSVLEVLKTASKIEGRPLTWTMGPRRPADPPTVVAGTQRIQQTLGFKPRYDDLEYILKSAIQWEKALAKGG